jgi:hypothetical protein
VRSAITAVVVVLAGAGAAHAQAPGGGTAPSYPGNTLRLEADGPLVAGTVVKVRMAGHAEWAGSTDETTIPYSLWIYAQNGDVHPSCEASYGAQQSKAINLPTLGASETLTDWVLAGDLQVNPAAPASGMDWSGESLPFVITPGVRNLLLCAYQRYVIDDVAWYQLPVRVQAPRCAIERRGRRLRLRCNLSGRMTLRFQRRGGRSRTIAVTVGPTGRAAVPTRRLRRGTYRVRISVGTLPVGTRRGLRLP